MGALDRSAGTNWVEQSGGLPAYIEKIAKSLHEKRGFTISRAIATAVSMCKRWAAGGEDVNPDTRAKAAAAIAEWEAKRAAARGRSVDMSHTDALAALDLSAIDDELAVLDLAYGDHRPPYDWKHGYVPISPQAARIKAKKEASPNRGKGRRRVAGEGPAQPSAAARDAVQRGRGTSTEKQAVAAADAPTTKRGTAPREGEVPLGGRTDLEAIMARRADEKLAAAARQETERKQRRDAPPKFTLAGETDRQVERERRGDAPAQGPRGDRNMPVGKGRSRGEQPGTLAERQQARNRKVEAGTLSAATAKRQRDADMSEMNGRYLESQRQEREVNGAQRPPTLKPGGMAQGDRVTIGQPRSGGLVYDVVSTNGDRVTIADSNGKSRTIAKDRLHKLGGTPRSTPATGGTDPNGGPDPSGIGSSGRDRQDEARAKGAALLERKRAADAAEADRPPVTRGGYPGPLERQQQDADQAASLEKARARNAARREAEAAAAPKRTREQMQASATRANNGDTDVALVAQLRRDGLIDSDNNTTPKGSRMGLNSRPSREQKLANNLDKNRTPGQVEPSRRADPTPPTPIAKATPRVNETGAERDARQAETARKAAALRAQGQADGAAAGERYAIERLPSASDTALERVANGDNYSPALKAAARAELAKRRGNDAPAANAPSTPDQPAALTPAVVGRMSDAQLERALDRLAEAGDFSSPAFKAVEAEQNKRDDAKAAARRAEGNRPRR